MLETPAPKAKDCLDAFKAAVGTYTLGKGGLQPKRKQVTYFVREAL